MKCNLKTDYKCEIVTYNKRCNSSVYCLYRRRVWNKGKFGYKHLYVCKDHARNNDRSKDTYVQTVEENYSGESSPYWQFTDPYEDDDNNGMLSNEDFRANPDGLSEDAITKFYQKEEMCLENEELIQKINENMHILSFREGQILNLICHRGMSNTEVARFLSVSPQAIENYLKRIQKKMKKFV